MDFGKMLINGGGIPSLPDYNLPLASQGDTPVKLISEDVDLKAAARSGLLEQTGHCHPLGSAEKKDILYFHTAAGTQRL